MATTQNAGLCAFHVRWLGWSCGCDTQEQFSTLEEVVSGQMPVVDPVKVVTSAPADIHTNRAGAGASTAAKFTQHNGSILLLTDTSFDPAGGWAKYYRHPARIASAVATHYSEAGADAGAGTGAGGWWSVVTGRAGRGPRVTTAAKWVQACRRGRSRKVFFGFWVLWARWLCFALL